MIKANIITDCFKWTNKIPNKKIYLKNKLKILSKISGLKGKRQEFSILLTNNKKIKKLNKYFRKRNKVTDVLSFPISNHLLNTTYIGDIAISFEIINQRSKKSNFLYEFDRIWVHGYLHLLGYDHKKYKDYKKMFNKENLILNKFKKIK